MRGELDDVYCDKEVAAGVEHYTPIGIILDYLIMVRACTTIMTVTHLIASGDGPDIKGQTGRFQRCFVPSGTVLRAEADLTGVR